jgi:uncharacterized glyoxalase superfamily protein PhnB
MQDRRDHPETLRLRSVMPALTVDDLDVSLSWYRDILGFHVSQEMKDDEDTLVGASLKAGSVEILLIQDDFARGRERLKGEGLRLYCTTVMDLDHLAQDIVARGGVLDQPPTDQPWGARDLAVTDPDGFRISISTPLPG